jgi:hypothetical protein
MRRTMKDIFGFEYEGFFEDNVRTAQSDCTVPPCLLLREPPYQYLRCPPPRTYPPPPSYHRYLMHLDTETGEIETMTVNVPQ